MLLVFVVFVVFVSEVGKDPTVTSVSSSRQQPETTLLAHARPLSVQAAQQLVHETCLAMAETGLVVGSAGNVSVRLDEHRIVVSAGGLLYDRLQPSDHPVVDLRDRTWSLGRKPTSELPLHAEIMAARHDVEAIVHTHSRYAAAFAVARQDLPFIANENLGPASQRVLVTEYAVPGSEALGRHTLATLARQPGSRACLLANHGVVAVGTSAEAALTIAAQVEWIAEVSLLARQLGTQHVLSSAIAQAVCDSYGVVLAVEPEARAAAVHEVIRRFELEPLALEGGFFRQTWRSPQGFPNDAPVGTAIYALFTNDLPYGKSLLHKLTYDEVWHAYDGDPFRLVLLFADGTSEERLLGRGSLLQTVVPAGTWMGGHVAGAGSWALLGCTMAPGFLLESFVLGSRTELLRGWAERHDDIVALTAAS